MAQPASTAESNHGANARQWRLQPLKRPARRQSMILRIIFEYNSHSLRSLAHALGLPAGQRPALSAASLFFHLIKARSMMLEPRTMLRFRPSIQRTLRRSSHSPRRVLPLVLLGCSLMPWHVEPAVSAFKHKDCPRTRRTVSLCRSLDDGVAPRRELRIDHSIVVALDHAA